MKTVVYLYESAFMMWRRRLEGLSPLAYRKRLQAERNASGVSRRWQDE